MKSLLYALLLLSSFTAFAQKGFVKVAGRQFTLDGKPYRYIGTNYWYGGLLATQGKEGEKRLKKELDFMKKQGIRNLRVMVGAEGSDREYIYRAQQVLQPKQGQFDDSLIIGLDYLLRELGKRDMKAVLHFTNTWEWSGGLGQYLEWNGYGDMPLPKNPGYTWDKYRDYISQFYTCEPCKASVDKYIRYVLGRTNTLTGVKYVDDPAIMAWEIINEPRPMRAASNAAFEQWMLQTATLIKSLDSKHLLTTGSEGDIATEGDLAVYERLHASAPIDYLTIHIWPKNWGWFQDTAIAQNFDQILAKTEAYVTKHAAVAEKLNKPLVLEEFGLPRDRHSFAVSAPTTLRDKYYDFLFGTLQKQPGAIAGYNFWSFAGTARPIPGQTYWKLGDDYMGDPAAEEQGLNAVFDADKSTWKVVKSYTKTLK